ncbi:uncharacterized protein LOC123310649 [Coccinella septempunctata]|uniref:uncharacterized protein LOC123310649 n=1 Tax=Coccinella septempunctata TaxID=41139 RepID=UPI001D078B4C|nr:uncharacterized protein LOC123310649 [Coccinella septempunctata]
MKNQQVFDILKGNFSRGETNVENYLPFRFESVDDKETQLVDDNADLQERIILQEPRYKITWPRICVYEYLSDAELKQLSEIEEKKALRIFVEKRIPKTCKEPARTLYAELMYTVIKFAKRNDFNLKQTGALLSQFYLTHKIFISSFNVAAEKLYLYFKEIMICHSVASPPDSIKIFSMDESENIMKFFCKIYLRNLPLIRTMCLPNFGFYLDTFLEPEAPLPKRSTGEKVVKDKKKNKKK